MISINGKTYELSLKLTSLTYKIKNDSQKIAYLQKTRIENALRLLKGFKNF